MLFRFLRAIIWNRDRFEKDNVFNLTIFNCLGTQERDTYGGDIEGVLQCHHRNWFGAPSRLSVLCVNDDVAIKVRAVAGRKIDVYGIDGLPEAVAAGIVTYRQPFARMARTALELIRRQQALGTKWIAREVRCRGKLLS